MTDEKNTQEAKIRKGLGPKRNSTSLQTIHDILIPRGSILRSIGDDKFVCKIGLGLSSMEAGEFIVTLPASAPEPVVLKRVTAA